jgi:hypothetical protein
MESDFCHLYIETVMERGRNPVSISSPGRTPRASKPTIGCILNLEYVFYSFQNKLWHKRSVTPNTFFKRTILRTSGQLHHMFTYFNMKLRGRVRTWKELSESPPRAKRVLNVSRVWGCELRSCNYFDWLYQYHGHRGPIGFPIGDPGGHPTGNPVGKTMRYTTGNDKGYDLSYWNLSKFDNLT